MTETPPAVVVLGAGIAGCLAAAAARQAGCEVVVLDPDPTRDVRRPYGAEQLHNLLGRAQQHLQELAPGFEDRFLGGAGVAASVADQTHVYELGVTMPERPLGLEIWSGPKADIESCLRASVLEDGVSPPLPVRATGLSVSDGAVDGVRTDSGFLRADVVVDAMGSRSPMADWVAVATGVTVRATTYKARQWYATLPVERPAHRVGAPDFWMTFPWQGSRGGMLSPRRDSAWTSSMSGTHADAPPRTAAEFLAYAATLEDPALAEVLVDAVPVGEPQTFHKPVAEWRRFDQASVPAGLVATGDALASLNPLFGQGVSVAAWSAAELRRILGSRPSPADLSREHAAAAASAVSTAWTLTTLFDPDHGEHRLTDAEWDRIRALVRHDAQAHREYVEVWHLLRDADWLVHTARGTRTVG